MVIIFIALTEIVSYSSALKFDYIINRYFISLQGNKNLDLVMITFTLFGDVSTLVVIGIIFTIIRRTRKMGMIFLINIVMLTIIIIYIKPLIGRLEPSYKFTPSLPLPKESVIEEDSLMPFARNLSYPSNHIACISAFAFIVGYVLNQRSRIAGLSIWCLPLIVAITKLYLMQHYLTDIIGGVLLGLITSIILSNLMRLDEPFLMSRFKRREDDSTTAKNY
jgi:undecaprenyl-diphosphatase